MKVCVSSKGEGLSSDVDPRFGRCGYFVIVETDNMGCETIKNPNAASTGGAGIQSGQLIAEKSAKVVLTGNVGPNAFKTLSAAGIEVITGVSGKIDEAIQGYIKGKLKAGDGPSVDAHFGD